MASCPSPSILERCALSIILTDTMKTGIVIPIIITAIVGWAFPSATRAQTNGDMTFYTVKVDAPQNGTIKIVPPIPEDHKVPAGTVLKIKATPARGFALDSGYYWTASKSGMYFEFPTPEFEVTIDRNKTVGASFIESKALKGFKVINNVVYAQPGVKALKYDVYSPKGAKNLPCIVIIHGGGWSVNCEDVMRGLARELVRGGKYVVVSVDYRWIGTQDGDAHPNSMADIIDDVFGAIAHIQEHAKEYGADPTRLAVTGDSAGGHLSAAAINLAGHIGDGGFGVKEGVYEFKPIYLPAGKTVAQVRAEILQAIKAAAPSYGVFSSSALGGWSRRGGVTGDSEAAIKAIAPQDNVPNIKDRAVPQFLLRGTVDQLIKNSAVQEYADALMAAGQTVEYVQVPGAAHAFLDWKPDPQVKKTFKRFGVPYAAKMEEFFDGVFYPLQAGDSP
jgi:acetyl esterase